MAQCLACAPGAYGPVQAAMLAEVFVCPDCGERAAYALTAAAAHEHSKPVDDAVRQELAFLRAEDADLLAHARAAVAAWRDGWPDPVAILADLLAERGQMPRPDQTPAALLATPLLRTEVAR